MDLCGLVYVKVMQADEEYGNNTYPLVVVGKEIPTFP